MKVLVLGGGVIGVTTAYYLAKAGHEVTVVDRQPEPALETSFANAGEVSPGYASPWAGPGVPIKAIKWLLMRHGPLVITKQYEKPSEITWSDDSYRGDAYDTYGCGCDVVELEVDRDTWQVTPIALTTVQEIGKAIHPMLARGQIEGGSAQGLGYALLEEVVMRDGRMANAQLTNYIIPTTLDTPSMDVVILEKPYAHGPFGAKGVGEMPIDGPAPAVINAIRNAGIDLREIPATPEKVMAAST